MEGRAWGEVKQLTPHGQENNVLSAAVTEPILAAYGLSATEFRLWQIFTPDIVERRFAAFANESRFVHYTTADSALKIARGGSVWLRNISCMNDFSEAKYGIDRVIGFFGGDEARPLWDLLDRCHAGLGTRSRKHYDDWLHDLRAETYLVCLSEHDKEEDYIGRLPMWRAYGSTTGIALVLNAQAFHNSSVALNTGSYPVCYLNDNAARGKFRGILEAIIKNEELLCAQTENELLAYVQSMLEYFSLCMKHPGFKEEREWRVVHRPVRNPNPRVQPTVEVFRRVPQKVYHLPLRDFPEEGLLGASLPALINRVIIGPTQYPLVVYNAIVAALHEVGVEDAEKKVFVSHIPLRQE